MRFVKSVYGRVYFSTPGVLSLLSNIQLVSSDVLFAVLNKWSKHLLIISAYDKWAILLDGFVISVNTLA